MSTLIHPERPVFYVYVIVRADVALPQQAVQIAHAALEAGFAFPAPGEPVNLVLLEVPDEPALLQASERLGLAALDHRVFYEPDDDIGHSALATRAVSTRAERALFRRYPLYRAKRQATAKSPAPFASGNAGLEGSA